MASNDIIADYREYKRNLAEISAAAQAQMQERYSLLLTEAAALKAEFKESFGTPISLPRSVKVFDTTDGAAATAAPSNGKKIGGLRRSLACAIKHGDAAGIARITAQLSSLGVDVPSPSTEPTVADVEV